MTTNVAQTCLRIIRTFETMLPQWWWSIEIKRIERDREDMPVTEVCVSLGPCDGQTVYPGIENAGFDPVTQKLSVSKSWFLIEAVDNADDFYAEDLCRALLNAASMVVWSLQSAVSKIPNIPLAVVAHEWTTLANKPEYVPPPSAILPARDSIGSPNEEAKFVTNYNNLLRHLRQPFRQYIDTVWICACTLSVDAFVRNDEEELLVCLQDQTAFLSDATQSLLDTFDDNGGRYFK